MAESSASEPVRCAADTIVGKPQWIDDLRRPWGLPSGSSFGFCSALAWVSVSAPKSMSGANWHLGNSAYAACAGLADGCTWTRPPTVDADADARRRCARRAAGRAGVWGRLHYSRCWLGAFAAPVYSGSSTTVIPAAWRSPVPSASGTKVSGCASHTWFGQGITNHAAQRVGGYDGTVEGLGPSAS